MATPRKKNPKKAGRKSLLTQALTSKIRGLILKGLSYKDIREKLNIVEGTWDGWINKDLNDFSTKVTRWKRARMLKASENVLSDIAEMNPKVQAMGSFGPVFEKDKKTPVMRIDVGILKVKQDTAKHLTETLGSDVYNKKVNVEHGVSDPLDELLREISDK